MKYLCVCNHGNVRSHCMSRELKDKGHEAIAIGVTPNLLDNPWDGFSEESIDLFVDWADKVLDFSDHGTERLKKYGDKVLRFGVGHDIWGNPFHPDLRNIMQLIIKKVIE